ncbi:NAD(P)-binding domain-containing protein [Planococcus shenhongbingii]|uniref:NAD(P)-binding domain-containing protein n=1 Tax=Planococcus shenhongbingii TaxID=3058398 RepID=UPI00260CB93E|nr:NAD(P)-binding domain-containing protein [Planococcus sp. N016]WKA60210.1 NAD(P)-binding domain-containing protein [Planococcus sp. N016]
METTQLPVAIIGGGPVGLAAAAQLVKRGQSFLLLELGAQLGTSFLDYGHVRLFSAWQYNIDEAAKELMEKYEVPIPAPDRLPYGRDIAEQYLQPLGQLPELKPFIHLNSQVLHISRKGLDKVKMEGRDERPFELVVQEDGTLRTFQARAVIDATGTWQQPNPLVSGGMPEIANPHIHYGIPDILGADRQRFEHKRIAVVGSGHSALNSILDLVALKNDAPATAISWILRRPNAASALGGGSDDQLPERGALGSRVGSVMASGAIATQTATTIASLESNEDGTVTLIANQNGGFVELGPFDEIIANTGSKPDFSFLREIRYSFDPALESVPALAPLIDPNVHSCGTVRPHGEQELRQPEKDFYIVGVKSYGRAPTFLMATGYEQVRSVAAHLSGDTEAAKRVELKLPETGVCSSRPIPVQVLTAAGSGSACCG